MLCLVFDYASVFMHYANASICALISNPEDDQLPQKKKVHHSPKKKKRIKRKKAVSAPQL
jgi:hypothetical protein